MFFHGTHKELTESIEAIGAGFAIYEHIPGNDSFVLISCNNLYEELLGKAKNEAFGLNLMSIFPRYVERPITESFRLCKTEQVALEGEIMIEYKGEERYWRSIISPILETINGEFRIIQTCVEITEKKILERKLSLSMKRFEAVVQSAYDGIITIDANQNVKLINNAARQIFGYSAEEIIGGPLVHFLPQKFREKHVGYVEGFKNSRVDSRPMQTRAAVRGIRKDGREIPIEVTISKIRVEDSMEMTAVIRDISEKNKLMEELLIASREDSLTNLFNRRHFTEILSSEILRFKRFEHECCLLMLDIDHFKQINDTFGHEAGDKALKELAKTLTQTVRETDFVGRWGGGRIHGSFAGNQTFSRSKGRREDKNQHRSHGNFDRRR
ncbi:two domain sensory box histidine kinase (PAS/PAC domain/GGDEF domain protein) [Desulforapulum autotrophicum HRM2]|uniref:Two domain sensory box histidine kinase (PAS/PAC domain/GGDEF domain protein) n=1 Tax=Desulforapulum autotrophicum (strain ATCC 43914 / DSM 3382 / VKM B-1955 / HRM2) TaxID=177437 RepID=C0QKB8_DESAH|nr:GGDEF domain-containing protein [Desulforapulum autotrophicum]ACN13989.1 two domain sensory box histidine kinase (PAS/PAC domain/GGDEF domain protein) [Desulforapulum autotrophicum HRM2]